MIEKQIGNLLDAKGIIVHGCNAQGVMGSGVAKQIKANFPEAFRVYTDAPKVLGTISFADIRHDLVIVNAITQEFYGKDGRRYVSYPAVRQCFRKVNTLALKFCLNVVNFPMIGCGLGGGSWGTVSKIIESELDGSLRKILWLQE